mgnify:FL=1
MSPRLRQTVHPSYPERFEAIANLLRSVARDIQIIMTTCHHERHRRLGVTMKRMESLKQQAAGESQHSPL